MGVQLSFKHKTIWNYSSTVLQTWNYLKLIRSDHRNQPIHHIVSMNTIRRMQSVANSFNLLQLFETDCNWLNLVITYWIWLNLVATDWIWYVYMYHADTWYYTFGYAEFKFSWFHIANLDKLTRIQIRQLIPLWFTIQMLAAPGYPLHAADTANMATLLVSQHTTADVFQV